MVLASNYLTKPKLNLCINIKFYFILKILNKKNKALLRFIKWQLHFYKLSRFYNWVDNHLFLKKHGMSGNLYFIMEYSEQFCSSCIEEMTNSMI